MGFILCDSMSFSSNDYMPNDPTTILQMLFIVIDSKKFRNFSHDWHN